MTDEVKCPEGRVREIVGALVGSGAAAIEPHMRLREDLGLDSVSLVDLMVELETALGVYFDPMLADLREVFSTVDALERYVNTPNAMPGQLGG